MMIFNSFTVASEYKVLHPLLMLIDHVERIITLLSKYSGTTLIQSPMGKKKNGCIKRVVILPGQAQIS